MAEKQTVKLIKLFREQMEQQMQQHKRDMETLLKQFGARQVPVAIFQLLRQLSIPPFAAFDSTTELWPDYWSRFRTFVAANAVPEQLFLTNQTATIYKQLANLATQQNPPKDINNLTMDEIVDFMKVQFDPKLFIVRERFKFWSDMQRKPGETLQEPAARIRQDAATCDFPSITNPQDEALRQRFICSVNNEAVLKALFKIKDTELDFARAVQVAIETEDAAKQVYEVQQNKNKSPQKNHQQSYSTNQEKCYRCGKAHKATDCPFRETKCHFCDKKGHLQAVCRKKQHQKRNGQSQTPVKRITKAELVKAILGEVSRDTHSLIVPITIQNRLFTMELDTATTGNFKELGKPKLQDVKHRHESASKHDLPVLGTFMGQTKDPTTGKQNLIPYILTKISDLNLLGRNTIHTLGISVDTALGLKSIDSQAKREGAEVIYPKTSSEPYVSLQQDCHNMCDEFPDLFKQELGCLKNFELEVKFKSDATPVFHKARPVPLRRRHHQVNLEASPVQRIRNASGTDSSNLKPKLRICGDYSVGINDQLADHRHPMPLPVELMQKLGGGFGYTKIDLADAYNQIKLAPESQRRLTLSTHRMASD
uniref:CCHC-type domain-containing protein n=1 Tax=Octopus bimaculoides TaxID=37653 RepID=A0A0L8GH78_OCTBM